MRYRAMMAGKQGKTNFIDIRKTNAQIHADNAVRSKLTPGEAKAQFKLKRFQSVNPRTSTKRGEQAYMSMKMQPAQ